MVEYPLCGRIINTHGCRGEVKIESFCDTPAAFTALPRVYLLDNGAYLPRRVLSARVHKGCVLACLEGISDMNTAEAYKGRELFAARGDIRLPAGHYLLCDLVGLPVIDAESGRVYGKVTNVESGAAYDMYEVTTENGAVLFPAAREFVREIRIDSGIYVTPIEGLFS